MSMFPARSRLFDELIGDLGGFYVKPLHGDPLPQSIRVDIQEDEKNFQGPGRAARREKRRHSRRH